MEKLLEAELSAASEYCEAAIAMDLSLGSD